MLDELGDAAGKAKLGGFFGALIGEGNFQTLVEEGEFAKALGQSVEAVDGLVEDRGIGVERNFSAGFAGLAGLFELGGGLAFFIGLLPHRAVAGNFELKPIGEGVDDRD